MAAILLPLSLLLIFNIAISLWNAYATGKAWAEARYAGGWPRFMTWMGAIMAASGLSWCILILLIFLFMAGGQLTPDWAQAGLDLGYVLIVPGILFSGLMITIDSWARAFRTRGILNYGVAGYNSLAQIYNTYHAVRGMGPAFAKVMEVFFGKGKKDGRVLVLILVVLALGSGILITAAIIHHVAAHELLPTFEEAQRQLQPA